ncbi:vomeronasal type-2 receptor 26-like [Leptodactylus fuscus]
MYPARLIQISYGATDPSLSDRLLYPHVFRSVQNSHIHYMVVTELLEHFGWTWVGILVSDDENGEKELQILRKTMREHGICVAYTIKYTYYAHKTIEYNDQILQDKTFILPPSFAFISVSSSEWLPEFNRSLVVDFSSQYFQGMEDFVKNFKKLPDIFKDKFFWEHLDLMVKEEKDSFISLTDEGYNQSYPYTLPSIRYFLTSGVSPRLYEAVEVLAKALHEMFLYIKDKSPENPITGLTQYTQKLQRHLQMMKSPLDPMGPSYYFNERGEAVHGYKIIYRLYIHEATYKDIREDIVGNVTPWAVSGETINTSSITWRHTQKVPVSRCSEPCVPGSRKKPRPTIHTCCYDCAPCSEGEISNVKDSETCLKCPDDQWPNEYRAECIPRTIEYLSYQQDIMAAVFPSMFGLLLIITISVSVIFIIFLDTPIVKANNRNISFILLLSLKLSLLCVFLFIGRPDDITCRLRQISTGVAFTVAVSSILAKSIVVSIAFKATRPGSPWRRYLGVRLPYSVVLVGSFFQLLNGIIWLSVSPPFQELDIDSYPGRIIIQCNEGSVLAFYVMLGYLGVLAAVSFVLAFMVRTLPDIYNEAKYITFSMLVFCSVWICAIPAYLSSKGKNMVMVEIFSILASEMGILGCIFLPKCYNIIMRPEMSSRRRFLERQ